ncbi:MAG: DUF349 domain-containing protein [Crocinitomicaceae bacterium]
MDKNAILSRLEELKDLDFTMELNQEFSDLTQKFYDIVNDEDKSSEESEEEEEKSEEQIAAETQEDSSKKEELEKFKQLAEAFKTKRAEFFKARDEEEAKNLAIKKDLIKELRDLVQNEENIGKAFSRIKEVRDKWSEIGSVSKKVHHDIQQEYSQLVEDFYYNINIYKALQENDLKRNLQRKEEVIESMKNLLNETSVKVIEGELRFLQNEWENIGPTRQEDWESIKSEYWNTVKELYNKIKDFYESRREESAQNLEKKAELIGRLKEVLSRDPETHKHWEKQTQKVMDIQKEWKSIGFGPREENEKLWKEFREICDGFFDKKRAYYKDRNQDFVKVKEAKEAIIQKVHELKTSQEWKKASEQIKKLQNQWKSLGNAGPRWEQKLWKIFRSHCDDFFDARQKHFEKQDEQNIENLKKKEALIEKIKAFKPSGEPKEIIGQLKELSAEFNALGNVPFKEKDRIYKAYKEAIDAQYDALDMDKQEKEDLLLKSKIETIMNSQNAEDLLFKERDRIRKQITKFNDEIIQLENNLGFFGKGSEKNPMVIEVKKKIEKAKNEVEKLKATLKQIPRP